MGARWAVDNSMNRARLERRILSIDEGLRQLRREAAASLPRSHGASGNDRSVALQSLDFLDSLEGSTAIDRRSRRNRRVLSRSLASMRRIARSLELKWFAIVCMHIERVHSLFARAMFR